VLGLSVIIAAWRFLLARRMGAEALKPGEIVRGEHELEANAVLTSVMSTVTLIFIYPAATGPSAIVVIAALCGMLAVATLYVSLVRRAFLFMPSRSCWRCLP